jgi:predicted O-methyltransferase YrrM
MPDGWSAAQAPVSRLTRNDKDARDLFGRPPIFASSPVMLLYDRIRWGPLGKYVWLSRRIPGWTRGQEALVLARLSHALPDGAAIVEIGSFLGSSAVLLSGARKLRGSGKLHCVDPFDASGDAFSVHVYRAIRDSLPDSLRQRFFHNIRAAGLRDWVEVHQGRASEIAATWTTPIDLLFMDGDQSYEGVRSAYEGWSPFLKIGGVIALHNSSPRTYDENHDGHRRLVVEKIRPPRYTEIHLVGSTTFARKTAGHGLGSDSQGSRPL